MPDERLWGRRKDTGLPLGSAFKASVHTKPLRMHMFMYVCVRVWPRCVCVCVCVYVAQVRVCV